MEPPHMPNGSAALPPVVAADAGAEMEARIAAMCTEWMHSAEEQPVVRLSSPDELERAFTQAGCAMHVRDADAPLDEAGVVEACRLALHYSVRSCSPYFFNQLYSRAEPASVVAEWVRAPLMPRACHDVVCVPWWVDEPQTLRVQVITAINGNAYTYEVAPVLTLIERHVLARLARLVGPNFEECHDGLMVPGGSFGNMYAMHLARHRAFPQLHVDGLAGGPRLVAFVSAEAHYSYLKSARLLGIGSANLISVPIGDDGGMCPDSLERAVQAALDAGGTPFFIGATAATTVRGSFDPFRALAAVADRHKLWLHVDGAWGGAALLSPTHRSDLDGADLADSFSWSAHKMLGAALTTSVFLTRRAGALRAANATNAAYLFQPDKLYTELDVGDKTIQCGRKADMFKLWLLFKSLGAEGCAASVDRCYALAAHLASRIRTSDGALALAYPTSCTNVCFWYVPTSMRPLPADLTVDHPVHRVAPKIKAALQRAGKTMIGFQSINGLPNFFRWVFSSAANVSTGHVDDVLAAIADYGEKAALEIAKEVAGAK